MQNAGYAADSMSGTCWALKIGGVSATGKNVGKFFDIYHLFIYILKDFSPQKRFLSINCAEKQTFTIFALRYRVLTHRVILK